MAILSAIAAMAQNRIIGHENKLPWHLPGDMQHFKALTTGHTIIMGRKTHESIGRALPNRTNIILSRNSEYQSPGCIIMPDIESAYMSHANEEEVFVIGGAEIYKQTLQHVERLYLTIVQETLPGDSYFPVLDPNCWLETAREEHLPDHENTHAYSFITLERIKDLQPLGTK